MTDGKFEHRTGERADLRCALRRRKHYAAWLHEARFCPRLTTTDLDSDFSGTAHPKREMNVNVGSKQMADLRVCRPAQNGPSQENRRRSWTSGSWHRMWTAAVVLPPLMKNILRNLHPRSVRVFEPCSCARQPIWRGYKIMCRNICVCASCSGCVCRCMCMCCGLRGFGSAST